MEASGRPCLGYELEAKAQLARLSDVEPRVLLETVLAMFMLREFDPRRFKSDARLGRLQVTWWMRWGERASTLRASTAPARIDEPKPRRGS